MLLFNSCLVDARPTYLGAGDADLGPSVHVHAAVRLPADAAAHDVGDADDESAALFTVTQSQQRVRSLTYTQNRRQRLFILCSLIELFLIPASDPRLV